MPGPPDPNSLVEELQTRQDRVSSFAGRGSVKMVRENSENYLDMMVAAEKPGRLRFQGFDFMGRPAFTMTVNEKELAFLDYRQAILYTGEATPENLSRFLPLGLTISEVTALLSGGQPLPEHRVMGLTESRAVGEKAWILSLHRTYDGLLEKIYMTPGSRQVSRVELGPIDGKPFYQLTYADYRETDHPDRIAAPFQITVDDQQSRRQLIVAYKEVRLNPELPPDLFKIEPPKGVRVEPIPK
jgi:hypothetical protein